MHSGSLRGLVAASVLCLGITPAFAQTTTLSTEAQGVLALAEELYPSLFKNGSGAQTYLGYVYRYYAATGIYVGFKDGRVYLMGGAFGPGITDKGTIAAVNTFLQDTKTRAAGNNTGAAAGTTWTQLAPLTSFNTCNTAFNAVAVGAGTWAAVGNSGCIRTSANGVDWTAGTQPYSGFNLLDVIYANGRFVAVGSNGYSMTSLNGSTWTRSSPTAQAMQLNAVMWTGTRYLAVGEVSVSPTYGFNVYTSTDGLNWIASKTTSDANANATRLRLTGVAGNGSTLVAVGGATTNCVAWRSTDGGDSWSYVGSNTCGATSGNHDGGFQLGTGIGEDSAKSVAYGNGKFVAVGALGSWATSTDGVKWTTGSIDAAGFPSVKINRITFDGTQFIAVGNQKRIYTSTDGATWTRRNADTTLSQALTRGNFYGIAGSASERLITVGDMSSGGSGIMSSVP